jgi:hypothetical protein
LCDGRREVDGEHLGSPLRRKTGVEGGAEGVVRMGGVPDRINAGKEVGRDGRRGGKLKWSKGGGVRKSVRREGKAIVSPRGDGSRRMTERGKEEEFVYKIAKGTKGIVWRGGGGFEKSWDGKWQVHYKIFYLLLRCALGV